ncbi:hypothetical protein DPMN_190528 [Dreissena polymorpha]|uniref:Uncharacterized protein n=1 Tax=Dreissena polymorpha TaxID=45954 RepID=A0A9D4IC18_DREPO|nr:hypothetical protein DPMN_190528 [Dreissena polymorpha]
MAAFVNRVNRLRRRQLIERGFADRSIPLEVLSSEEVRERYRFRPETIYFIVGIVFNDLDTPTRRSLPVPPLLSVLISLQFFATGCHHLLLTAIHGVSRCSVGRSVANRPRLIAYFRG